MNIAIAVLLCRLCAWKGTAQQASLGEQEEKA